ncbi:MAG TPA: hypothetical protein VMA77_23005 [Solirubrobacteraceae bacterium]|nr:hypothetical protein [Solirubrobacteraceae bacterium]
MTQTHKPTLAMRVAHADEADIVRRLAQLDDAPTLSGEILLAVVDGETVAALSLSDGRVVANPFLRTADAVALLRIRAAQLSDRKSGRHPWRYGRSAMRRAARVAPSLATGR